MFVQRLAIVSYVWQKKKNGRLRERLWVMFVIDYYIKKTTCEFVCICKHIILKAAGIDDDKMSKCLAWHKRLVYAHDLSCFLSRPRKHSGVGEKRRTKRFVRRVRFSVNWNAHAAIFPLTVYNTIMARVYERVAKNRNVYMCIYRPIPRLYSRKREISSLVFWLKNHPQFFCILIVY